MKSLRSSFARLSFSSKKDKRAIKGHAAPVPDDVSTDWDSVTVVCNAAYEEVRRGDSFPSSPPHLRICAWSLLAAGYNQLQAFDI